MHNTRILPRSVWLRQRTAALLYLSINLSIYLSILLVHPPCNSTTYSNPAAVGVVCVCGWQRPRIAIHPCILFFCTVHHTQTLRRLVWSRQLSAALHTPCLYSTPYSNPAAIVVCVCVGLAATADSYPSMHPLFLYSTSYSNPAAVGVVAPAAGSARWLSNDAAIDQSAIDDSYVPAYVPRTSPGFGYVALSLYMYVCIYIYI